MRSSRGLWIFIVAVVMSGSAIEGAKPSSKQAFVQRWQGHAVVLQRTLYSLVYNERSRVVPGRVNEGQVRGLTVAATDGTTTYEFPARRGSEQDIVASDPDRVFAALRGRYVRSALLEQEPVQDVVAVRLERYQPGAQLVVQRVQFDDDRVCLLLHRAGEKAVATSLTVRWPVPLSKELTEASPIEDVLERFLRRGD
jgi:hypothetical protein